jgi:hypothetical protein
VIRRFDAASAVNDLCQLIHKADALAHATEHLFEGALSAADDEERRRRERLAHLVGATAEAVRAVVDAGDLLASELVAQPRSGSAP